MVIQRSMIAIGIVTILLLSAQAFAENLKSGLQVGELPTPFNVKDCTGPAAGKTLCYYCRYGRRPVISVFTRQLSEQVVDLVKQIDAAVDKNRDQRMAAFVVVLGKDGFATEKQLKSLAEQQDITRTPLTIYRDTKAVLHENYRISPKADVTVMMWNKGTVKVNFSFADGQFNKSNVEAVMAKTTTSLLDDSE